MTARRLAVAIAVLALLVLLAWRGCATVDLDGTPESRGNGATEPGPEPGEPDTPETPDAAPDTISSDPRGCSISGFVKRDGRPAVARVEVRRFPEDWARATAALRGPWSPGEPLGAAISGADGRFVIRGLPAAFLEVTARAEDGAWGRTRSVPALHRPHPKIVLELIGGSASLSGLARHRDGRPFRGLVYARLPVGSWTVTRSVRTAEDGRFTLGGLHTGEVEITFIAVGKLSSSFGGVTVPTSEDRVFVVDADLREVRARVVAADDGSPVEGARISCRGDDEKSKRGYLTIRTSDADGRFTFFAPGEKGGLWIEHDAFHTLQPEWRVGEANAYALIRMGRWTGRVVAGDDGRPVPGVTVHPYYGHGGPKAVSDVEGRFDTRAWSGRERLYAFGAGWLSEEIVRIRSFESDATVRPIAPGETREIDLVVVRTGRVEGVLLDRDGRPVPGVLIFVDNAPSFRGFRLRHLCPELCTTTTGPDGSFRLDHLIPGYDHLVIAQPEGAAPVETAVTVDSGQTRRIELRLLPERWLPVRVVDEETGEGIAGAWISARHGRHSLPSTRVGEDGRGRLGPLGEGMLVVSAQAKGYIPRHRHPGMGSSLHLPDPGPTPALVEIHLTPGAHVAGRLRRPDGSPHGEGLVGLLPPGIPPGTSYGGAGLGPVKEDGSFRHGPVPAGRYDLVLFEMRGRIGRRPVRTWRVTTGQMDLELTVEPVDPPDPMVIRVLGPEGRPARGGISLWHRGAVAPRFAWLREGKHDVIDLPPGSSVWIEITDAKVGPKEAGTPVGGVFHGPVEVRPGTVDLRLGPDRPIAGRVVGRDGEGVAGLVITAIPMRPGPFADRRFDFDLPRTRTGVDGRFRITSLAAGRHRLRFMPGPEYALVPPVVVDAGTEDVLIRLVPGAIRGVTVFDPAGKPVAGAKISVFAEKGRWVRREAVTDARGTAEIAGSGDGHAVLVEPPSARGDLHELRLDDVRRMGEKIVLPAGALFTGVVRIDGTPVAYAVVWSRLPGEDWRRHRTDRLGRFRISAPAGARASLRASPPGAGDRNAAGPETSVEAGSSRIALELPIPE